MQGVIKQDNSKRKSDTPEYCLVIDRFSKFKEIPDDREIPGSMEIDDKTLNSLYYKNLEGIAESKNNETLNFIGVVLRVGPVGFITLRNGEQKTRRNVMMCDESNITIVVCFWSDKFTKDLEGLEKKVLAIVGGRVSDYSGKSINVSEDSRIFIEPNNHDRCK